MQNNALLYGIGAVAIVGIALVLWTVGDKKEPRIPPPPGAENRQEVTRNTTMRGLLSMDAPQQCTFTSVSGATNTSGVVYIADGKMRGDFSSLSNGQIVESYMIVDNNTSYVWSDAAPQGVKMSFDASAQASGSAQGQSVSPDAELEYSCSSWTPNPALFVPPSGIQFFEMSKDV